MELKLGLSGVGVEMELGWHLVGLKLSLAWVALDPGSVALVWVEIRVT